MTKLKKNKDKQYGPVSVLIVLTVIISLLSFIFSMLGIEGYKTLIANNTIETTLITIKNIVSLEGIKFIIGNAVQNFSALKPLVLIIISLLGISICEKSGLLSAIFSPLKRVKLNIIIFITLLLGVISTIVGDYGYIFLIPLVGVMFKYLGKNPVLGIITVFIGITVGYGTGIFFNYNDYLLGAMTQAAAKVSVDSNYAFSLFSNIYIMLISSITLCISGTILINKFLVHKLPKRYSYEEEELLVSSKAKKVSMITAICLIILIIYMVLPINTIGAGILLDSEALRYMDKLLGPNSPFGNGLVIIVSLIMLICGMVYGKISGNIKSSHEFSLGMSKTFENLEFMFVLLFFAAQLIAITEWTNIGPVIGTRLIDFMSTLQFSGVLLIIAFFIIVILMSILIPSTIMKWEIASPVVIPLFMKSNITPNMTQFIFKVADGVGKAFTPLFVYYIITLAFLEKYRIGEKNQVSVFGTMKMMAPVIMLLSLIMLILIILWYLIGLPIGVGTYSTL